MVSVLHVGWHTCRGTARHFCLGVFRHSDLRNSHFYAGSYVIQIGTRSVSVVFRFVSQNQKKSVCFGISNLYQNI
jgi:hypothetical protein